MSDPLFILHAKTNYEDNSIRIELEPQAETDSDFWADVDKPNGRCEFYLAPNQNTRFEVGAKYRISIYQVP